MGLKEDLKRIREKVREAFKAGENTNVDEAHDELTDIIDEMDDDEDEVTSTPPQRGEGEQRA